MHPVLRLAADDDELGEEDDDEDDYDRDTLMCRIGGIDASSGQAKSPNKMLASIFSATHTSRFETLFMLPD